MKRLFTAWLTLCAVLAARADGDRRWAAFCDPDPSARTKVWWFHGETETTEAGIDADLEAFRAAGIGGVVFYDQVHGSEAGAVPAMSPDWWRMLKYAARKAKSLGLSFEVAASNGYLAGGPWIAPEHGMQQLAAVDTVVRLDRRQELCIALPHADPHFRPVATLLFPDASDFPEFAFEPASCRLRDNEAATLTFDAGFPAEVCAISYRTNPRGKGSTGSMNIPGPPQERYFGALYTELPPIGELEYSTDGTTWQTAAVLPAVENVIGYKSKERTVSFPTVCGRWFRVRIHDWIDAEGRTPQLQLDDVRLATRDRIDNWQVKSGLRTEVTYPHPEGGERGAIEQAAIRDLTGATDSAGVLRVTLDPGCWHILRFGHIPTGGRTKHGRSNLLGLEADVLSPEAVTIHYNHYFKAICDTLAAAGCKPDGMCMDSHEAGIQNWTRGFEHRFRALRGYDLIPWLPALRGYLVGSRAQSEAVLRDFRRTVAETVAASFYGTFAQLCRADGVCYTSQAMQNIDSDNLLNRSYPDKPQGEFWGYQTNGNYDCLDAASSAHLYGRPIASAEAFTDTPYGVTWDELLRIANLAYCRGINEFAVCASTYQPWLDRPFDDSASAHPYVFHRHHPQWSSVAPFWDYQARCATLLREGDPVVDLCVYIGEEVPLKTFAYKLPELPEGYNFDVCSRFALLDRFAPCDGAIAVKGGMRYRALVVQDRTWLSPEVLEQLEQLAAAGVPVIRCDRGESVAARLAEAGIRPDCGVTSANRPDDRICFFHRRTADAEIYFVYNHSAQPFAGPVVLRDARDAAAAEAWDPRRVTRTALPVGAGGRIDLQLAPYESRFLIVRR